MTIKEIEKDIFLLRVDDRKTRFFESMWEIPEGITYNSYLVRTGDKAVLIDGWKSTYSMEFEDAIREIINPSKISHIIIQHMEPDHTGSLKKILSIAGDPVVLGHPLANKMIESFYQVSPRFQKVKDGEKLELNGVNFRFIYAPWIHWPETLFTYIEERGVLFTCDGFGGYGVPACLSDDECIPRDYLLSSEKYMVTVVGHYRKNLLQAIEKLENLGIEIRAIYPGHGLLWRKDPQTIISKYKEWAIPLIDDKKAVIIQVTMYGITDKLVNRLSKELSAEGYNVMNFVFNDSKRPSISEVLLHANRASILVLASGTYEASAHPLIKFIAEEIAEKISPENKAVIIVATHGWGPAADRALKNILGDRFNVVGVITPGKEYSIKEILSF